MKPADNINGLIKKLHLKASAELDKRVHDDISKALAESEKTKSARPEPNIWRIIMKSSTTRIAAAAVIIIAVLLGIHFLSDSIESVAIADIVQPFLTARTATFNVTIDGEGVPPQEFDGMFMEPCRMRKTQPGGGTVIVDIEQGKIVILTPEANQAIVIEVTNAPEDPGDLNFFQYIRMRILNAQPLDDESVEFLGEQQIDGQPAIGYHVRKPGLDAIFWANSETKMPLRIEVIDDPMVITMSNIVFDVELDESLFSLDVPDGYNVTTLRQDLSEPTEEDFIESFRIWAENMDGKFPSKMDRSARSAVNELVQYRGEKMKEKGIEPSIDDVTKLRQIIIDMTHGFPFVEALPADSDWHYTGRDVKFGDADKAIFWYRPEGSGTYRVIYGDLSVKDISPENLPK